MIRGLISIFAMPQEIDDLHLTLYNLKRNVSMLPRDVEMDIDITFCLSDELTEWDSVHDPLHRTYFYHKFNAMAPLWDWSKDPKVNIESGKDILGCVSQRRHSLQFVDEYDFTIWLDTDIFFKDTTLLYMVGGYQAIKNAGIDRFILTPQFVKQWDNGWDLIVNKDFLNHKIDYELEADIFQDTLIDRGEVEVAEIPGYKFAGGWFTLLSNDLLRLTGVPDAFGHYGLEDTYITSVCDLMKKANHPLTPTQYVLVNHLVGETYVHRCNEHLKLAVNTRNRKEEFRSVASANFNQVIKDFLSKINL